MRKEAALLILLCMLSPASAGAQQPGPAAVQPARPRLPVGDPAIQAAALRPFSGTWRIVEVKPDGTRAEIERSTDRLEIARYRGRKVWRQVQREILGNSGVESTIVITDYRSFAPILVEQSDGRDRSLRRITYKADGVLLECSGHLCPPGMTPAAPSAVASKTFPTATAAFDFWGGSWGLIFAILPLRPGSAMAVPAFHPVRGLVWLKLDVLERESVTDVAGRRYDAFRIRTPETGANGGWTWHVSKAPPYWVRLEFAKPDGTVQITERV